jgi:eukaryotic-like serine/threonine-protein kinase
MTPERWRIIKEVGDLALEREPAQRAAFLAIACRDDELLCRDVESVIARATASEGILDGPIWEKLGIEPAAAGEVDRWIPASVGGFRLLRVIGEGGMGIVYEAEQDHPRRIVALKVIRPGFASPEFLRRFARESEVLARLQHPGIAQIYEAGAAETDFGSQPYFAMEFIHGMPLGEYAQSHHLDTRQRLELIAKVCDGVDHAHQRGVIHRDLKPGNIPVDETGQPKVLDFGVARVTEGDAPATEQTDLGQMIGTLAYMSPEQVAADPLKVDQRSDVYALGVILYELLAGRLPYQLSLQLPEAVLTIQQEDPTPLRSISRAYRGDVETIVAKALEKDKARRYESAAELAGDIRRYLEDEPISARPASLSYQVQKFTRRHKGLVAAAAVVFVVLAGGIVVSTREALKARQAEQTAQAINDFLQNDLLAQASTDTQSEPGVKPDPHLEVRTALDRAAARLMGKFDRQPEVEAAIRDTIAQTYIDLGLYAAARTQLERALALFRRVLGVENPKTLRTMSHLAFAIFHLGQYTQAAVLFNQTLEIQRSVLGSEHPDTLNSMNGLANDFLLLGKYAQAEALHKQILEIRRRVLGPENRYTLSSMYNLAIAYQDEGRYAEAEALFKHVLEFDRRTLGPDHQNTLRVMQELANIYNAEGKYAQAEGLTNETLAIRRRVLGLEHPETLISMRTLAVSLLSEGKYPQAEALSSQVLELDRRVRGPQNVYTLTAMETLASAYSLRSKFSQAEALFGSLVELSRRVLGPEHPYTLGFLADLASMYQRRGEYALAEVYAAQALAGRRHALGSDQPDTMASAADLALAYQSQQKFAESETLAREALEFYRKKQPDDWHRFRAESLLGASLSGQKRYAEAGPLLLEGYQGMLTRKERMAVPDWYHLDRARQWIVELYRAWGNPMQAAEWRQKG